MKGLTEVGLASSSAEGDTKFANVMNIVDVVMQNGSGDLEVAYGSGVTTGTQTQNIALSNVAAGTLAIGGVENLNISSGLVKSTLTALTAAQMKSISVTGSTDLKITGALDFANDATGVAGAIDGTIDASAFTGKLTVTSAADEVSITGGSGNDTFNMAATFNGYDKIDGGDGTDTLTMDAAALSTQFAQTSNIENVTFNESNADTTVDMSKLSAGV
jgi:S-layer protein